nr:flagellar biosynthetic protein FliR [Ramlibacter aurantiacus]
MPFLRVLALFSAAPLLSSRAFPVRARIAAAMAIGVVVSPFANVPAGVTLGSATGLLLVLQQVLIGVSLGFAARLLFAVFETAGEIIGLQMGLSFAGFFNPQGGTQSAVSSWLNVLAMLLFVSINAHLVLIEALVATFETLPITADPLASLARLRLERLGADVFQLALALALPATVLLLFVNGVLGLASRVAPQMSIFAVGFPITLALGMVALLLGVDHLAGVMTQGLERFIGAVR